MSGVRVGAPDASLTSASGLAAVAELVRRLGVIEALNDAIGPIKQRDRGVSGGGLLVALAQAQMLGADFLSCLDRRRADVAGEQLSVVPTPASTTAAGLARRFTGDQLVGIEDGIAQITRRVVTLLPAKRRAQLQAGRATIDVDGTDVRCYGLHKDGIAFNYKGERAGRPHVACWAEAGIAVAADLLAGDEDPRSFAADLIADAAATLRAAGVTARPRVRGDVGYFAAPVAWAAVNNGCDFSLGVRRTQGVWRAAATISEHAWSTAHDMDNAQVAVAGYTPAGWPPDTRCVVRRVRHPATDVSTHSQARRQRTIPQGQLALALDGLSDHVYAYSFIATNIDVSTPAKTAAVEAWHRNCTDIEDRIRDAKHGAALRHLPSGDRTVNAVWMWAALIAVNLSAWLQELARLDNGHGRRRAHINTLRHRLLTIPARLIRHSRQTILRLPPGHQLLAQVLARLRKLPTRI